MFIGHAQDGLVQDSTACGQLSLMFRGWRVIYSEAAGRRISGLFGTELDRYTAEEFA
jgi:hypothetical protein